MLTNFEKVAAQQGVRIFYALGLLQIGASERQTSATHRRGATDGCRLLQQHHLYSGRGRFQRSREPGRTPSNDQKARVH